MNTDDEAEWFRFEHRELFDFEDEPVLTCYLGKLFHFWQGRNAYWGRWSSTYPGDDSFCVSLEEARRKIERRRVQGSQWWIAELPVLVLGGVEHSLLVTEINTNEPVSTAISKSPLVANGSPHASPCLSRGRCSGAEP